jgi:RNA polymerase sigma factor (TIGR02999 family)
MSERSPNPNDVTQLLLQLDQADGRAVDRLLPLVYDELRGLAAAKLRGERPDHTLNATALVHEAYLKLIDQNRVRWQNRAHFFAVAARAMRRILIDHANARMAQKRGGGAAMATLHDDVVREARAEELVDLDEALTRLEALDERQARIVEMSFFVGLTHQEIAEVLGVSLSTVDRDWRLARAWLSREMRANREG